MIFLVTFVASDLIINTNILKFYSLVSILIPAIFWVVTQRVVVIIYRRFGTTYRYLQGSRIEKKEGQCSTHVILGGSLQPRTAQLYGGGADLRHFICNIMFIGIVLFAKI